MAENKIKAFFQEGLLFLEKVNVDADRKEELLAYTREMMKREY